MKRYAIKLFAAVLMLSALFATAAYAEGWEKEGSNWLYRYDDGTTATDTWITDEDGNDYWVGSNGIMASNTWISQDGKWYYLDGDGHMLKNTLLGLDNNTSWYLLDGNGVMQTNTWYQTEPDEETGNSYWYYFGPDGQAYKGGWYNIDGDDYYFLKSSKMAQNALVPGGGSVGNDGRRLN